MTAKKRVLLLRPLTPFPGAEEALAREVDLVRLTGGSDADLLRAVADVHAIVASNAAVTEAMIRHAPLLEVIGTPQAGFDKIDVKVATEAGVCVVANTGVAPEPVAEFTIGLLIALARRIVKADRDLRRARDWKARGPYGDPHKDMGTDLKGATIGVAGFGNIGATVARFCQTLFSARVLAYDPFVSAELMAARQVEKVEQIGDLASRVQFLLLHVALTQETRQFINEAVLRRMSRDSFVVNCARGQVVDQQALIQALEEGWIRGAALDVFEDEPIAPDNPLLTMDNVIVTPHIAGVTVGSAETRGQELVRKVLSALAGRRPEGLVNPEAWTTFEKRFSGKGA